MKRDDVYYEAMKARDPRFDGKFFVGVKTTGIYCRPICPAKPKRENIEFFQNSHQAEASGYRPCLRCRPESAPQSPAWIGKSATVQRAMKFLNSQATLDFDEDSFAEKFGVTARHLRRLFVEEIGKTPKQLAFENRLNLARKLIVETNLSITEAAFAAGFSSVRRFNDAFKERFKKAPREIRKAQVSKTEGLKVSLPYRPPFDFEGLMKSYRNHRVGNLEWFEDDAMTRVVSSGKDVGLVTISNDSERSSLIVEIDFPDTTHIQSIIHRVRGMFDLDSDPVIIANSLDTDKDIKKMLKTHPGIRLPSGWDPFELAIGAILGQLVSVEFGQRLLHDLIEIAGAESGLERNGQAIKLFPTPEQIIKADLQNLKTTGIRKNTLKEFSKAIAEGRVSLEPTQDVDLFLKAVLSIKGIGPWTAHYIALKSLRSTDTFPSSDLILNRALQHHPTGVLEKMRPWRGYVAALFWRIYSENLSKKKKRKSP
jgi:AraC family transcriptional regulator of adaptative response / DNA-3-methyladenine glycosylase II